MMEETAPSVRSMSCSNMSFSFSICAAKITSSSSTSPNISNMFTSPRLRSTREVRRSNLGPSLSRSAPSRMMWTTRALRFNAACEIFEHHMFETRCQPRYSLMPSSATTTWRSNWFRSLSTAELLTSPTM